MSEPKRRRIADEEEEEGGATPMDESGDAEVIAPAPAASPLAPSISSAHENFSPELLKLYYDRIFPAQLMCRWLSYLTEQSTDAAANLLHRREFSFTTGDDVYIRYLSYEDHNALRKDLVNKLPHKIDIGAVFSAAPRDHKKYKLFEPQQRELIIDIDLTDYDFLEVDVKKLETCDRCWPLMALAMRVLNRALADDFGFEHMLWVYSGRRGIHCWACDTRARVMSNEVRSAVADYLGPRINAAQGGRMVITQPMHPSLKRAYDEELAPFFSKAMLRAEPEGFGILDTRERQENLLAMLADEALKQKLLDDWDNKPQWGGEERWEHLRKVCSKHTEKHRLASIITEIVFSYTYPRLDVNVSKGMNHLLKSPWCVHPKTGRVCVPVAVDQCELFDPSIVPTLKMIAEDLDAATNVTDPTKLISHTRLATYEDAFDAFLRRIAHSIRGEAARNKAASLDF